MDYGETHKNIINACKQGDRNAQFTLYRLYSKAMYNVCLRMVRNEADAEDLLQYSFIDVFTKLDSFRQESSVGAWIKRIVINNCINWLKKRRLQFTELDERFHDFEDYQEDRHTTEEVKMTVDAINRAIYKLPDGYRVVFSLYALEGYDHEEIGQILDISTSTSKSQYSRAKRKILDLLNDPVTANF
ncbi:MAG: RNA polymerase sigma factor [Saprospiraceae bacterium]|nr:RNA polymerase sigma factor [Saprospiraceae bacterium]